MKDLNEEAKLFWITGMECFVEELHVVTRGQALRCEPVIKGELGGRTNGLSRVECKRVICIFHVNTEVPVKGLTR